MSWNIACFCGHLIDTTTCPHCGSTLPDLTLRPAVRPDDAGSTATTLIRHRPSPRPHRAAA